MKNIFNVSVDECGYYLLLTTRGLGEFDSFLLGKSKPFASVKTYEEYYGYDDSNEDSNEESNEDSNEDSNDE